MSIRSLIVDDEQLARHSIRRFLKYHPNVEVVDECGDGQTAVNAILAKRPDPVFLDVQMPELDGFAVVNRIGASQMPATIFVTAYDQYALNAFDANASDYLLKPFGKARFDRALGRARERLSRPADHEFIRRLLETIAAQEAYMDTIPVAGNGRVVFIKTRAIQWIEGAGNYARLHLPSGCHDLRETLTSLESKLNPREFVRVHRSIIVNLHYVRRYIPGLTATTSLFLKMVRSFE